MIARSQNTKQIPINIVGSSTFGRYPKISIEKTFNMFASDNFMVPYAGYQTVQLNQILGTEGRGIYTSTKFNNLVVVVSNKVYLIDLFFDQSVDMPFDVSIIPIGTINTNTGPVYITSNNKPQILISDNLNLYLYDPTISSNIQVVTVPFTPGYVDFHNTRFLAAVKGTSTWQLSASNDGTSWPGTSAFVGALQTKPDNVQAIVRVPSRGNLIYVMGSTITEPWYDVGYQLFPYQRNNSYSVDYGCLNPATIASNDDIVVWLAANEKSGPIIMYTRGGEPQKITTDGIDYLFAQLTNPADSQGFLYRQDGHLFYHINFYTDNLSLFYDFNTNKFYHACDENFNYFIANEVAFFNNQYYFLTKNNGNLYAFDTIYTTYNGNEIPRARICHNVRLPSQEFFIANDVGFTIETGETDYLQEGADIQYLDTEAGLMIETEDGANDLITEQGIPFNITPRVDLSISVDGGATFGSDFAYDLNPIGQRRNRLMWWQLGIANDLVLQFKFHGLGRFVTTDGILNIRQ